MNKKKLYLISGILVALIVNIAMYAYTWPSATSTLNIAAAAGFTPKQVTEVGYGALLADIGMISVPQRIRFKETPLAADEQLEIMRHTLYGIDRLQLVHNLPRVTPLVGYQSHERLDGSGYPQGLKGEQIILEARIMAVADVVEAMSANRPYRPGLGMDAALEEITRVRGAQLDAVAVDACLRLIREKGFVFTK